MCGHFFKFSLKILMVGAVLPLPTFAERIAPFCAQPNTSQNCVLPTAKTAAQEACEIEQKTQKCDEYIQLHPELKTSRKLQSCKDPQVCASSGSIKEFLGLCISQMGEAWKDIALGTFMFFTGQGGLPSESDLAKLAYFKNCTSAACKRQMLGSFQSYFSKEEIEGHAPDPNLDSGDIANKNYLEGYSAAVLYRKLLLKLKKESQTRQLGEKFLEPWSGQEARLPLSFQELIDQTLQKAGMSHTACFKPQVVTEMRCYALFSILDPTLVAGAALKIARIGGLTGKEAALIARNTDSVEELASLPVKVDLPSSGNTQVDIWRAREAGQKNRANAMEEKLISDMKSNEIKSIKTLGQGRLDPPLLLEFDNGVKGVWKSSQTEGLNAHAEAFAYQLDRHLGENRVPVTIERDLNGKPGTFQYYIDEAKPGNVDDPENFIFFDYLIENGDRHGDNYLVRADGRTIAIDHGLALDSWNVPDFPRHVDSVLERQKKIDQEVQNLREEYSRAQRGGVGPRQLEVLGNELKKAESEAKTSRANAQQEIAAMGISARATAKIADTPAGEWNKVLSNLSEAEKKKFFERKDKAMKAIEKAYDYLGDGIYSVGPYSARHHKAARPAKDSSPTIAPLQGSGL